MYTQYCKEDVADALSVFQFNVSITFKVTSHANVNTTHAFVNEWVNQPRKDFCNGFALVPDNKAVVVNPVSVKQRNVRPETSPPGGNMRHNVSCYVFVPSRSDKCTGVLRTCIQVNTRMDIKRSR